MPLPASKSTSRRETHGSSSKEQTSVDFRRKTPLRRSRSVSAVSGSYTVAAGDASVTEFLNKRDNPLFCCSSSSSPELEAGDDGCGSRRGRSFLRRSGYGSLTSVRRNPPGGSLTRVGSGRRLRSVSREHCDYFENLQTWSSRHPVSDYCNASCSRSWEDRVSTSSLSEVGETTIRGDDHPSAGSGVGCIYETVCSEVRRAVSEIKSDMEQVKNLQTWSSRHPASDYCNASATRSWEDMVSTSSLSEVEETTIRGDDHPSAGSGVGCMYETVCSEVRHAVSEIKSDIENALWGKNFTMRASESIVESPKLVNPDSLELVSDVRMEYETKLMESHERARKLRADLAVEEQREQEISRMLEDIIPDEDSASHKSRPRRKLSIERLKMSRRLAEDAMNYFDECVSISTFDSSDFSSAEDQQELESQTKCSIRTAWSNLRATSTCSSIKDTSHLLEEGHKHDKLSNLGASHNGSFKISSAFETARGGGCHDLRHYIKFFEKEPKKSENHAEGSSSFNINDYDFDNSAESLLLDIAVLRNRIESGSLLLCDIRTF